MSRQATGLNPQVLRRLGLEPDETLAALEEGIRADLDQGLRLALRIAVRASIAKRAHFGGDFARWCGWIMETTGISKRQAIAWDNAGHCVLTHLVRSDALARCSIQCLEVMAPLDGSQMLYLLSKYPEPAELTVKELRALVNRIRGKIEASEAADAVRLNAPPPRQPELPGFEVLERYEPASLKPYSEALYAAVFLRRTVTSLAVQPDALTEDEASDLEAWIATAERDLAEARRVLAARRQPMADAITQNLEPGMRND